MQRRRLGRSGLDISVVGFGAWPAGGSLGSGTSASGWSGQRDEESIAAIHRALELGVNWIDTAPVYGQGHSESVVARALSGMSERPYVFSKCGFAWDDEGVVRPSLQRASIRLEVEASLRRLNTDVIDLLQIHSPAPDEEIEEGWAALAELKAEGKVRHIGVSNFDTAQLRRCQDIAPVESLQPPYSLLDRSVETEILPYAAAEELGVIVWGPLAHGLLTGTWTNQRVEDLPEDDFRRENNDHFRQPQLQRSLAVAERLGSLGRPPGQLALAWVLRRPEVTGAIVGLRRPAQVNELLEGADLVLPENLYERIEALV